MKIRLIPACRQAGVKSVFYFFNVKTVESTRKVAHNTAIQIVGKAISTIFGLIAIGMMTRYLGVSQFGWYITAISFLQFIGILIDFGMTPVTAQMLSEQKYNKETLLKNLLGFRFVTATFFLTLAPLVALFFPYPIEVKHAIALLTISFLAIAMNQVFVGYYQTRLQMHVQAAGEVIGRIILVAGLWLMITGQYGFVPVMIVVGLSSIGYVLFMWAAASRTTKIRFAFDWHIWKSIMQKSWPIAISIIFNVVYLRGDVILLSWFQKFEEVGLYGAAYRVIDILGQTAMMMMGVILPLLAFAWSRNNKKQFKQQYQQAFDAMMLFAIPVTIGTIILAEPIIAFVAGNEFIAAGRPLQILSLAVFGVFFGAIFGHTAVAIDKQKQTMWVYISNAILSLIAYLIFIPKFGMYGAAWVTVFSEVYAGLFLFLVIRHYTNEILDYRTLFKLFFSAIVMAVIVLLLPNLHVIALAILGAGIYGIMVILTGAISKETLKSVLKLKV